MKVTIHSNIAGHRVHHLLPPAYRDAAASVADPGAAYSVLLFAHAERDVVPSAAVRKGLRRLGPAASGGVLAVGTVFTEEALALLAASGARVLSYRAAYWTDESARQRQS